MSDSNCPRCGSSDTRYSWGIENFVIRPVAELFLFIVWLPLAYLTSCLIPEFPPVRRKRLCLACGAPFAENPDPIDYSRCAQCGYELTGSAGPVCPECGWRLPGAFRRARTRADRARRRREKRGGSS